MAERICPRCMGKLHVFETYKGSPRKLHQFIGGCVCPWADEESIDNYINADGREVRLRSRVEAARNHRNN